MYQVGENKPQVKITKLEMTDNLIEEFAHISKKTFGRRFPSRIWSGWNECVDDRNQFVFSYLFCGQFFIADGNGRLMNE